jgi:hypothetical protein
MAGERNPTQTGYHDDTTTWGGGTVPSQAAGEFVGLVNGITVTQRAGTTWDIGDGTSAIVNKAANTTGRFETEAGADLRAYGKVEQANAPWILRDDTIVRMRNTTAATSIQWTHGTGLAQASISLTLGSVGHPVQFISEHSGGALPATWKAPNNASMNIVGTATWTDFTNATSSTNCFQFTFAAGGQATLDLTNPVWNGCGNILLAGAGLAGMVCRLTKPTWKNGTGTTDITGTFTTTPTTTGLRVLAEPVCSKGVALALHGLEVTNGPLWFQSSNIWGSALTSPYMAKFTGNFCYKTIAGFHYLPSPIIEDNIGFTDNRASGAGFNCWTFTLGARNYAGGVVSIRRNAAYFNGTDASGDAYMVSGGVDFGGVLVELCNNLAFPNSAGVTSGTPLTHSASNVTIRMDHNTFCTSGTATGASLTEGGASTAGTLVSFQSNLGFAMTSTPAAVLLYDNAQAPTVVDGFIVASGYNHGWNIAADPRGSLPDTRFVDTPLNNLTAGNPGFAGQAYLTKILAQYIVTKRGIDEGSDAANEAKLIAVLRATHLASDPDHIAGVTPADIKAFMDAALTPTAGAVPVGHDGLTKGAINVASGATPVVAVTPSGLTFNATQGGSAPASQPVSVTEGSGGALTGLGVSFSYGGGWASGLSGSFDTTTAPATLTVSATQGVLAPGTYTAMGTVSGTGATSATFNVTLIVAPDPVAPGLGVSETRAVVNATVGGANPPPGTIRVRNVGGGVLSGLALGAISYGGGWASGLTATLDVTTAPAVVTFQATTGALAIGKYTATVSLSSSAVGAVGTPQTLTLEFGVEAAVTVRALGGNGAAG